MLPRMQLVELEDLDWFPAPVRDAGTDYLRFAIVAGDAYGAAVPLLVGLLHATGATQVVDLCSGGGGPWQKLLPALEVEGISCAVVLTDRYPNPAAIEAFPDELRQSGRLSYHPQPVNALAVAPELHGVRTIFSALHHFPPETAAGIIGDAVRNRAPIAIFEATQRTPANLLLMPIAPLVLLLVTPLIKPFRWSRLLFTYLLPLVPFMVLWDGIVSCLRSYTAAELHTLLKQVPEADGYDWVVGAARSKGPIPVTYLIGMPKQGA